MKKNRKGFTLVELIAVVVVLIIVLLLAINRVRKSKQDAYSNALKANALSYIKAVDEQAGLDVLESNRLKTGLFDIDVINSLGVKLSGDKPNSALFCLNKYRVVSACVQYKDSQVLYENGEITSISKGDCVDMHVIACDLSNQTYSYSYSGTPDQLTAPKSGRYFVELWGAQGGDYNATYVGGKGAYTSGIIELTKGENLYVYVGGKGVAKTAGYNGGAPGGPSTDGTYTGGGGASDVRLVGGVWNNAESLKSRIMVAAGGSGSGAYSSVPLRGGAAGSLVGLTGNESRQGCHTVATGATQTSAGLTINGASSNSAFGYSSQPNNYGTGGGGGYYGGGSGSATSSCVSSGAGGSSYISGYTGCVAIDSETSLPKEGCTDGTTDNECSIHYSGRKFVNPVMKAGNEKMPTYNNEGTMVGNAGDGYVKITFLG